MTSDVRRYNEGLMRYVTIPSKLPVCRDLDVYHVVFCGTVIPKYTGFKYKGSRIQYWKSCLQKIMRRAAFTKATNGFCKISTRSLYKTKYEGC